MTSEPFNTTDLELLAQAYFDCRLDRAEELALKRLLTESPLHSPLLDSCRAAMGLETAMARAGRRRRRSPRAVWISAAASVAVILAIIPAINTHEADNSCIVYVSGHRITDPEAAEGVALREMEADMRSLRSIMREAETSRNISSAHSGSHIVESVSPRYATTSSCSDQNRNDTATTFKSIKSI